MITKEKLNLIYEDTIKKDFMTTQELKEYGFSSKELTELVKNEVLRRVKRGEYVLEDFASLYCYGCELVKANRLKDAKICFLKYSEKNPEQLRAYYKLLNVAVLSNSLDEALKYYDLICKDSTTKEYDKKLMLYLLNAVFKLPFEYGYNAKYLLREDILVPEYAKRTEIINQNEFRGLIYKRYYKNANEMIDTIKWNNLEIQEAYASLLKRANHAEKEFKNQYVSYVKQRRYSKLIEFLEYESNYRVLTNTQEYILKVAKDCQSLLDGNGLFVVAGEASNMYEAIDKHNYSLAIMKMHEYRAEKNITSENALLVILEQAYEIFKNITVSNSKDFLQNKLSYVTYEELIDGVKNNILSDYITFLKKEDYGSANEVLEHILQDADAAYYVPIIKRLGEISKLENDKDFTNVIVAMTFITNKDLTFDVGRYLGDFYTAINNNDLEKAELYLDIIEMGNNRSSIVNDTIIGEMNQKFKDLCISEAPRNEITLETQMLLNDDKINYLSLLAKSIIASSKNIDDVRNGMGLNDEESAMLYLLCAKEYYELNQRDYGNILFRQALEYSMSLSTLLLIRQVLSKYLIDEKQIKLILEKKD